MNVPDRFNDVAEVLLADRSPARQARHLGAEERRMLLMAQRIRGSQEKGPDLGFVEALRFRLKLAGSRSARAVVDWDRGKQSADG